MNNVFVLDFILKVSKLKFPIYFLLKIYLSILAPMEPISSRSPFRAREIKARAGLDALWNGVVCFLNKKKSPKRNFLVGLK